MWPACQCTIVHMQMDMGPPQKLLRAPRSGVSDICRSGESQRWQDRVHYKCSQSTHTCIAHILIPKKNLQ